MAGLGLPSPLLHLTKKHQYGKATCVKQDIDSVTAPQQLSWFILGPSSLSVWNYLSEWVCIAYSFTSEHVIIRHISISTFIGIR